MLQFFFFSFYLLFSAKCPQNLNTANTLASYDSGAAKYNEFTKSLDMRKLQDRFLKEIRSSFSKGSPKILSVGAGPCNRDEIYFLQQGFQVVAYDGSPEMIKIAKENIEPLGGIAQVSDFINFFTSKKFEGIWALASLHHIPKADFSSVLIKHEKFLKLGGIFLMSLLKGEGESFTEAGPGAGKYWSKHSAQSVREMVEKDLNNFEILYLEEVVTGNQGFEIPWVTVLLKKVRE